MTRKFSVREIAENNHGTLQLNFLTAECELCEPKENEKPEQSSMAIPFHNGIVVFCGTNCFMKLVEESKKHQRIIREQAQAMIKASASKTGKKRGRPRKVS